MLYGIYKGIREASWRCLLDYGISSLPVDLLRITRSAGIKIVKNSDVNALSGGESGLCIFNGERWFIIYDDEAILGRRRFTIAHELGHIFLGHELTAGYYRRGGHAGKPKEEKAADMFAARLLAPACVLWGLGLHTWEEIAEACSVSTPAAINRAQRMETLYKRGKFLSSPLERRVYKQFKPFIDEKTKNRVDACPAW